MRDEACVKLSTIRGKIVHGDSKDFCATLRENSVDLIMTSPPFALVRKKTYGNADAELYLEWFRPFANAFKRVLRKNGSLVLDIGGAWIPGQPTRSLYHFKLLVMLCEEFGFHLAQEFYWWNPAKLPTPAEWVTVRRIRVKDAVNCVWWLSPTPWPRADNRRVLQPYSDSMRSLLKNGYKAKKRPSGHDISEKFNVDNGASIPPNLIAIANTESNGAYLRHCSEHGLRPHDARYPAALPEYFVRMLTDPSDLVLDPFAGSCVTGEVCERLKRKWICVELDDKFIDGAKARFIRPKPNAPDQKPLFEYGGNSGDCYRIPRPGALWNGHQGEALSPDGGRSRKSRAQAEKKTGHEHSEASISALPNLEHP